MATLLFYHGRPGDFRPDWLLPTIQVDLDGEALVAFESVVLAPPTFPIDGARVSGRVTKWVQQKAKPTLVFGAVVEHRFTGPLADRPDIFLTLVVRMAPSSPVYRFRYELSGPGIFTSDGGPLEYFTLPIAGDRVIEWRFAEFNALHHTFLPAEVPIPIEHFRTGEHRMGPMLRVLSAHAAILVAYEHGSEFPDAFLEFRLAEDQTATLTAVKGNVWDGLPVDGWKSVWFQVATARDDESLARAYRSFVFKHMSPHAESRKPYIFYNTWNHQERVHAWNGQPYLAEMHETRMLAEIDVAAKMGIDVFVIDTGWYEKTGDWRVSSERFPRGLSPIVDALKSHGMKLGLWFNPTVAAVSSEMRKLHDDCLMLSNGTPGAPHEVWETEASQGLSLVSRYADAFADELIRLNRELGVTYFKWDAIGQYGSDAAGHFHGTEDNSPKDRRDAYAFLLGRAMVSVVEKLCAACPDAIVDFDITEGGRSVGLEFLSAGKYFLINNGPYDHEFQVPPYPNTSLNLFFFPGPARAWICRRAYEYDRWIPSVLFLTHYLPDDDFKTGWGLTGVSKGENRAICLASLMLGHNGIWGDLLSISSEGVAEYGRVLSLYKQVRDDITEAFPVRVGAVGGPFEVHEKILETTGRGVVCLFAGRPGTHSYITQNKVDPRIAAWPGVDVELLPDNRAKLTVTFGRDQHARLVLFGVESQNASRASDIEEVHTVETRTAKKDRRRRARRLPT